jgi:tetratricopeptide (TPR) repeat protein
MSVADPGSAAALAEARRLVAQGADAAATAAYLAILRRAPTQFAALNELATLAYHNGHRAAARSAYTQAVACHPENPVGHVNLGNLLLEDGALADARACFAAALACAPTLAAAHQGMARVLTELGEDATAHAAQGFAGHEMVVRPCRGAGPALRLLLLVAACGGNIPTGAWIDAHRFAVTAIYADRFAAGRTLPDHDLVLCAIADADRAPAALAGAQAIIAGTQAPVINPPARVAATGRADTARLLAGLAGVVTPAVHRLPRAAILAEPAWRFPLLLRAPGFHTGRQFLRVDDRAALAGAVAQLPGAELFAIDYLDARGADSMARKYRVMAIGGALYPIHLAISADWKVHYFTADMAAHAGHRAEERRFLDDMPGVLGPRAIAALEAIAGRLGLDYAGVDFALAADGAVQVFEANAGMVIAPPDADPMWDYRRPAIDAALAAARRLLVRGSAGAWQRPG